MSNGPRIEIWGEVDGDKRGVEIIGGDHETDGITIMNGVKMSGASFTNKEGGKADINDLITDGPVVNHGELKGRRWNINLESNLKKHWPWLAIAGLLIAVVGVTFQILDYYKS